MREIRLFGSEGGVVRKRHPYPYLEDRPRNTINRERLGLKWVRG